MTKVPLGNAMNSGSAMNSHSICLRKEIKSFFSSHYLFTYVSPRLRQRRATVTILMCLTVQSTENMNNIICVSRFILCQRQII